MDFENFEGFKKILNDKELSINKIYGILNTYIDKIGNLKLIENADDVYLEINFDVNVIINISIKDKYIIIERILIDKEDSGIGVEKTLITAQADRLIEQIYDLINDYIDDEIITEHITKANKFYSMNQIEPKKALGIIPISNQFVITDKDNKNIYTISQNILNSVYSIYNIENKREEFWINYKDAEENKYVLIEQPFTRIELVKKTDEVKTIYVGKINEKNIKISGDYTDNHFLIEVDEIVVGAVDCLNITKKTQYRLEINNDEYLNLIIGTAIMCDIDNVTNYDDIK